MARRAPRRILTVLAALVTAAAMSSAPAPAADPCSDAGGTPGVTGVRGQYTCTFSTPDDPVTPSYAFVVPAQAVSVTVDSFGASGGNDVSAATGGLGGRGAEAQGTFASLGGQTLRIVVGGAGGSTTTGAPGYPDGGAGGNGSVGGGYGAGGGAGSAVTLPSSAPLVVAGGGGGAGRSRTFSSGAGGNAGAAGLRGQGGLTAGGGQLTGGGPGTGASGGTVGVGGIGGSTVAPCSPDFHGAAGSNGSTSGGGPGGQSVGFAGGGGGGGGYRGGGGGGGGAQCSSSVSGGGGGGGGASFVDPGATDPAVLEGTSATHAGDGEVVVTYTLSAANLIADGGLEQPRIPSHTGFARFAAGAALGNWTVTSGSVDLVTSAYWTPFNGRQSLDLDGDTEGSVSQQIDTVPGASYRVRFALAGVPQCAPTRKTVVVTWDGTTIATKRFDASTTTTASMGWVRRSVTATATSPQSTLAFASATAGACGAVIDAVSVTPR